MKKCVRVLALSALAVVFGILHPASARAQGGLAAKSPSELEPAMKSFSSEFVTNWSPAVPAPAQNPSPRSRTVLNSAGLPARLMPLAQDGSGNVTPATDNGPLINHGGPIMSGSVTIYPVFWVPAKLQTGASTGMTAHYQAVQVTMLSSFLGRGLGSMLTQYYQKSPLKFIADQGGVVKYYTDSSPYPASGCNDPATPGNCLSDAQIQAEVKKVMSFAGTSGGLNKIFMIFTSSGEGTCMPSGGACSYHGFCAYHSHFMVGSTPVIYSNQPFGTTKGCQVSGAPSPNGDPTADAAATSASHELSEAMSDPLGSTWFTAQGNENGDLCAYKYGPLTWDGGRANQMWNGNYYLLQTEYDNHYGGCYQVGP